MGDLGASDHDDRTTLMIRNIPRAYTNWNLLDLLDRLGFAQSYDFVYLPANFSQGAGIGHALVNCTTHSEALRLLRRLQGFDDWGVEEISGCLPCEVCWSHPNQGLAAQIERYRDSPVMHDSVPGEHKPMLFSGGRRVAFPPPTRRIRPPRIRPSKLVEA